jgi:hypothetical protein
LSAFNGKGAMSKTSHSVGMVKAFWMAGKLDLSTVLLSAALLDWYEPAGAGMALVFDVVETPLATR